MVGQVRSLSFNGTFRFAARPLPKTYAEGGNVMVAALKTCQVVLGRIHLLRCNCLIVIAKGELLRPTKTQAD